MLDWSNAKYAKAGPFIEWLHSQAPQEVIQEKLVDSSRWQRRYYAWRTDPDTRIPVTETLDEFLVYIGIFLSSLPNEVFCDSGRRDTKKIPVEKRAEVVQFARENGTLPAAQKFKVGRETVVYYLKLAKAGSLEVAA